MVAVIEYPKIAAIEKVKPFFEAYEDNVRIEEKIDGSNVALRLVDGALVLQSRTTIIDQDKPGMFKNFVAWAQQEHQKGVLDDEVSDVIWYGEAIGNGKLKYQGAPPFILFDACIVKDEQKDWATYLALDAWSHGFGWPLAASLYIGPYQGVEHVKSLLGKSQYGDFDMEGVVVKATNAKAWYTRASDDEIMYYTEPLLLGKYVREDYKEMQAPKRALATVDNPLTAIAEAVVTEARIQKAKQRAQEEGKDISRPHVLIPYVLKDVHDENKDDVMQYLFDAYWKKLNGYISKRVVELEALSLPVRNEHD